MYGILYSINRVNTRQLLSDMSKLQMHKQKSTIAYTEVQRVNEPKLIVVKLGTVKVILSFKLKCVLKFPHNYFIFQTTYRRIIF